MKRLHNFSCVVLALLAAVCAFGQTAASAKAGSPKTAVAASAPVDINSASMGELKSVPGIGDAYASKIMAGRPYKNKAQLKSRNILPTAVYEKVKANLVATQK